MSEWGVWSVELLGPGDTMRYYTTTDLAETIKANVRVLDTITEWDVYKLATVDHMRRKATAHYLRTDNVLSQKRDVGGINRGTYQLGVISVDNVPTQTTADHFINWFNHIAQACHQSSRAHGFWDQEEEVGALVKRLETLILDSDARGDFISKAVTDAAALLKSLGGRNKAEQIALMHSELSELLEGLRGGNKESDHIPGFTFAEEECADTIIRLMDFAVGEKLRVAEALVAKMKFNEGRPIKHGKKF